MKKTAIATSVALAISGAAISTANAAAITSITLSDVWNAGVPTGQIYNLVGGTSGTDGSIGRFGFNPFTTSTWDGTGASADLAFGGVNQGPGVFTTGFPFGADSTPFAPSTDLDPAFDGLGNPLTLSNNGLVGDITGTTMTIGDFDWGGVFGTGPGITFYLAPDPGTFKVNFINDIGGGDYEVAFSWEHYITPTDDPTYTYASFTARWVVEGVAHTEPAVIPVPAAAWLMGSGLVGLAGVARRRKKKTA